MYYKYALPIFLIYSFDNDDMKSSKRHVTLLTLIFLLKSVFYKGKNFEFRIKSSGVRQTKIVWC